MSVNDFWLLILPDDSGDFWAAVQAVATIVLLYLAFRIAHRQLRLDSTPVLVGSREGGQTLVRNVGRGVALTVVVVDPDFAVTAVLPSVPPGDQVELPRVAPTVGETNRLYYVSVIGQWFEAKLTGRSFMGREDDYPVETAHRPVRWLPASVRSRLRRHARSAVAHMAALESYVTVDGIDHRWKQLTSWATRSSERLWFNLGEDSRQKRYASVPRTTPATVPEAQRRLWELDIEGLLRCRHSSPVRVHHYSCRQIDNGAVVCEIALNYVTSEPVSGLVVVTPRKWSALLMLPKSQRSDIVWEKTLRYLCGRFPGKPFVLEI